MPVLASDLIEDTRRLLFSAASREELNKLQTTVTSADTSFVMTYDLAQIQRGSIIEMDLELIFVWAADNASKTLTVQRGYLGSTAASHSAGAVVYVNPKFPRFSIFQALNDDILDLSSPLNGLFQIKAIDLTYNAAVQGYDMTAVTDLINIFEIRYKTTGSEKSWPVIRSWELARNMSTSEFASGFGLILYEGGSPGRTIRVRYKAGFTEMTSVSDVVTTTTGLPVTALDIPQWGAAAQLVGPRDVRRGFYEHQGEPRRAEEVPPGVQIRSYSALAAIRRQRIAAEAARLYAQYPPQLKQAR